MPILQNETHLFLSELALLSRSPKDWMQDYQNTDSVYGRTFQALKQQVASGWKADPETIEQSLEAISSLYFNVGSFLNAKQYEEIQVFSKEVWKLLNQAGFPGNLELIQRFKANSLSPTYSYFHLEDACFQTEVEQHHPDLTVFSRVLIQKCAMGWEVKEESPLLWAKNLGYAVEEISQITVLESLSERFVSETPQVLENLEKAYIKAGFYPAPPSSPALESFSSDMQNAISEFHLHRLSQVQNYFLRDYTSESIRAAVRLGLMQPSFLKTVYPEGQNWFEFLFDLKRKTILPIIQPLLEELEKVDAKSVKRLLDPKGFGGQLFRLSATAFDVEMLKWLVGRGLDLHAKDQMGETLAHALMRKQLKKKEKDFLETWTWLEEQGLDFTTSNNLLETPLSILARRGSLEVLQSLIDKVGVDQLRIPEKCGKTAFDYINERKDRDKVLPLLEKITLQENLDPASTSSTFKPRL